MTVKKGTAKDHRLTVALTFDFDAESGAIQRNNFNSHLIDQGIYGAREGVPRVLRLLDKYKLPATFFIPGYTADHHPNEVRSIAAAGYEIAHHTYQHKDARLFSDAEERNDIEKGFEALKRVAGKKPKGYRTAGVAGFSKRTLRLLCEYGFTYDSSANIADRPCWAEDNGERLDLVEIPHQFYLADSLQFMFVVDPPTIIHSGISAPSKVEEIWREEFNGLYDENSNAVLNLTMHPQYIGPTHRMRMLERLIIFMMEHDGVWFAQTGEIADEFRRRESLK